MKDIRNKNRKSFGKRHRLYIMKRNSFKKNFFKKKQRKTRIISKTNKIKSLIKVLFIIILSILVYIFSKEKETEEYIFGLPLAQKMLDYESKKFAIIRRTDCPGCGLFSFQIVYLGCVNKYLSEGYIPILDLQYYKNRYNSYEISSYNPWELFFYQPYNYTMEEVQKYAKNKQYFACNSNVRRPNQIKIFFDINSINYWGNLTKKYIPVKHEIVKDAEIIMNHLFGKSKNILGVKIRGTDYLRRPGGHPVQPKTEQVISDVKTYDEKYKYEYIFFTSEDENIKRKFVPEFKDKIKLLNLGDSYMRNFTNKNYQHLNFEKNYILNVIILSRCLDLLTSKCNGVVGAIFFSKGFRNTFFYDLGEY